MLDQARRRLPVAFALIVALTVTGCTGDDNPAPVAPASVGLGLLIPETGANAALGKEAMAGAQLALDVVNRAHPDLPLPLGPGTGLRNGARLNLIVGDTAGAPEKVEQQASRLVREGAVGIVIADDIAVATPAGRETDIINVALVDAISTSDLFADLNRSGHFRIQPSDSELVQTALALLFRERGKHAFQRIVVAGGKGAGLREQQITNIRDSIRDLGRAGGYTVLSDSDGLSLTGTPDISRIGRTDVVLAIVTNPQEAEAANDLAVRLKGTTQVIAIGPGVAAYDAMRSTPQVLRSTPWSAEYLRRHPIARVIAGSYEQRAGVRMSETAAAAFTAVMVLAIAMDSAVELTPQEVRTAVRQLSMPATQTIMPWDGVRFDANGYNQLAAGVVEQRVPNGFLVVHPVELASAAPAF